MKKTNYKYCNILKTFGIVAIACLLSITAVHAQDQPDDPNAGGDLGDETTTVPFDGGVGLFVVVGIAYGTINDVMQKRKGM